MRRGLGMCILSHSKSRRDAVSVLLYEIFSPSTGGQWAEIGLYLRALKTSDSVGGLLFLSHAEQVGLRSVITKD